jgi:hypothetical protein
MVIRGREFSDSEIDIIKDTIANNTAVKRRQLSILICEQLNWRQPNGNLKDRACRDVLLRLEKKGIIQLPEPLFTLKTQDAGVKSIDFVEPSKQILGNVEDFGVPVFKVVENTTDRKLWNFLIDRYHYKGCRIVVGRHLKYLLYLDNHLIGCFCFADAVLKLTARDQWIGWNQSQREARLSKIINNVRFLILPWVKIYNLASKLLSLSTRVIPHDWERFYHFRPVLFETFVERNRFTGASYKASNWIYLGQTLGKGRSGMRYYYHGIIKDIYVYPLVKEALMRKMLLGVS